MKKFIVSFTFLQITVLTLVGIVVFSAVYSVKQGMARELAFSTRNNLLMENHRDAFLQLGNSKGQFSKVEYCIDRCESIFQLNDSSFLRTIIFPVKYQAEGKVKGVLNFYYPAFEGWKIGLASWFAFLLFTLPFLFVMMKSYRREELLNLRIGQGEVLNKIASRVAHDIRSPIEALKSVSGILGESKNQEVSLLKMAISRIESISKDLLSERKKYRVVEINVNEILENLITEKKTEDRAKNIVFKLEVWKKNILTNIGEDELYRIISNLINNSLDAGATEICIKSEKIEKYFCISIVDNGPGIEDELIPKVLNGGFSSKGTDGNGIGVSSSKDIIEEINGRFSIENLRPHGLKIKMEILLIKSETV